VVCTLNIVPLIIVTLTRSSVAETSIFVICVSTAIVRNYTHYGCPQHLNQVSKKLYLPQVLRRVCQDTQPKPSIHDRVRFAHSRLSPKHQLLDGITSHTPRLSIHYTHTHSRIDKAFHIINKRDRIARTMGTQNRPCRFILIELHT
jgi:hypothetical protein